MKGAGKGGRYASPAAITGMTMMAVASLIAFLGSGLAAIPLAVFVLLCALAPFFPSWGFFLPLFSRGQRGEAAVSLTFDDGPDSLTTRPVLQMLARHGVKATFFVTGERAARYGGLIEEILAQGHAIGNHSYRHDPFLMLCSTGTLTREIMETQHVLQRFGIVPAVFRPPVGITSPRLACVLNRQGLICVTFSCRAYDCGNRFIGSLSARILRKVVPGDIILLHDVMPEKGIDAEVLLEEFELILKGLKSRGLRIVPLAELLGRPVMVVVDGPSPPCPDSVA